MIKPRKKTLQSVIEQDAELAAYIEEMRTREQRAWENDVANELFFNHSIQSKLGSVIVKHSRSLQTALRKAEYVQNILREMNE